MEYREPSRIVAPERRADGLIEDADSPSRMRRFEFVRPAGRLDVRRLLAALLLFISVGVVVLYVGRQAIDASVSWLHRQPRYQLRFDQIELVTPPPEFFRGGASAFLEGVRRTANEPEVLSTLDLDPGRIERAFKLSPWVEEVETVAFPPRRVVVRLVYNEPAAVVRVGGGDQVLLDRSGRILPLEDVDTDRLGRPIQITGEGVVAPAPSRIGLVWRTESPDHPERAEVDRSILQAAKLAGFFNAPDRKREAESTSALRMLVIAANDPRGLFVQSADNVMILWGEAPGEEKPDEPQADEKWRTLDAKTKLNALKPHARAGYWRFTRDDLRFQPTIDRH